MTEDEAKTKWCPFAKDTVSAYRVVTPYRGDDVRMHTQCLASACMAWRTDTPQNQFLVTFDGKPEETWSWDPTNSPHYAGRVQVRPNISKAGFCGLAGQDRVQ